MDRAYISDASSIGTEGKCVAMYRIKNKVIDSKNVAEVSKDFIHLGLFKRVFLQTILTLFILLTYFFPIPVGKYKLGLHT